MTQETTHTPEPWDWRGPWKVVAEDANDSVSLSISHQHGGIEWDAAARILACVNACEGMADPEAEIAALRARVAELEKGGRPMNNCTHEFSADGQFKRCLKCGVIWPTMGKEAGNE